MTPTFRRRRHALFLRAQILCDTAEAVAPRGDPYLTYLWVVASNVRLSQTRARALHWLRHLKVAVWAYTARHP